MKSDARRLIEVLDELAELLESDGESHWRAWILRARARLEDGDTSGAEYLLSAYGGMGSFNDLVLAQSYVNGSFSWKPGHEKLNERLTALRSEAWTLAQALKRERQRAGI
jgi:hypothetical protein